MIHLSDGDDIYVGGFLTASVDARDGMDRLVLDYSGKFNGYFSDGVQFFVPTNINGAYIKTTHPSVFEDSFVIEVLNFERFSITGSSEVDILNGREYRDVFYGLGGRDVLTGFGGKDFLVGGGGDDTLSGGDGGDRLKGGAGDDNLGGGNGKDFLIGGKGNDGLNGGLGRDVLRGGPGDDALLSTSGSRGLDRIDGNDVFWGGAGSDVFIFDENFGRDKVMDLNPDEDGLYLAPRMWRYLPLTHEDVIERFATFYDDRVVFDFTPENPLGYDATEKLTLMGEFSVEDIVGAMSYL